MVEKRLAFDLLVQGETLTVPQMAPEATNKLATSHSKKKTDNSSIVKSKYWNKDGKSGAIYSNLPLPKRRRANAPLSSHEPGQMRLQSLPVGGTTTVSNKEQYKRESQDVFDFQPGTTLDIKEEPQYQDSIVVTVRSKHSERKVKSTQRGSQPACKQSSTTQEFTVFDDTDERHEPNNDSSDLQQPGAPKDSVYDLFVRSATEANCFATGHDGKAVKRFNKRVRRAWARMEPESRAAWVKLFQCSARRCASCHQRQ